MNYFIDCGTHFGQGIQQISSIYGMDSDWKIITFEANPVTHEIFTNNHLNGLMERFPKLESINVAVSTYDGEVDLNIEIPPGEGETGQGTSIMEMDKWKPQGGRLVFKGEPVKIKCIDFSNFLKTLEIQENDKLIIKLDIEGAEYDVLESLIENYDLSKITEILIEFHHHYFSNSIEMLHRENTVKKTLHEKGVNFRIWH